MRILHIINSLNIGGAEKLITDIIPLLNNEGLETDLLLLNGQETAFKENLLRKNISIYSLGNENNIYNPLLILKIRKYLIGYDIIHVHIFPSQYWVAFASLLIPEKKKLVTTEHSTSNRRRNISWFKPVDRFIYSMYDKIISISPQVTVSLNNYLNFKKNAIITIPNGIDYNKYKEASRYSKTTLLGIPEKAILITQVAGFREEKDQDTVIKALKDLPENYHLMFVGDGKRLNACKELANSYNLTKRVHFIGKRNDVEQLLKTSDILVMSSHWEGFGLAALEGMAAGKPVLASNVPGLAEVVEGAGMLFPCGNHTQLAELIKEMSDVQKYNYISSRSQEKAKEYDLRFMIKEYIKVYTNL